MKRILKITLLVLIPILAFAQPKETKIDSLYTVLKNTANDTIRMDVSFQLALYFNEINRDSALFYLEQSLPIAQKLKLKIYEADILQNMGYVFYLIGNYPKALEFFLQALKITEDPSSEKNFIGLPNQSKGQTASNARLNLLGYVYLTMGHLYGATGNPDKQMSSYFQAKNIAETVQDKWLNILANMNLGSIYLRLNKLDSALLFEQTAVGYFSKSENTVDKYSGNVLNTIGKIYQEKGNFDLAIDAFRKALKYSKLENNLAGLARIYISISNFYQTTNNPDSSLMYANKALEASKILDSSQGMANAYFSLSSVYNELNKTDSAFTYLKLATAISDSLNNVQRQNLLDYQNLSFDEQIRLRDLEDEKASYQNKIRTNALVGGLFTLLVIAFFLFRNNRQKQKAKQKIEHAYDQLKATQSQLIQSEKMASLGELTAGIAHEIQNPLNFVNNFSEVSNELIDEMDEELGKGDIAEAREIGKDIKQNLEKINHHGQRASSIVKGMLEHSRAGSGEKVPTDINVLCDEYLRLSYHGLRAKDKSFNADFKLEADESLPKINVVPQDIGRVLLNLINNAFYAVDKRAKEYPLPPKGGSEERGMEYKPTVVVSTSSSKSPSGDLGVKIVVKDNGNGIPSAIKDKIFQPFFTTKPTGSGTGLGLSLSYDIVKAHGGTITVDSKESVGTEFIITIPIKS